MMRPHVGTFPCFDEIGVVGGPSDFAEVMFSINSGQHIGRRQAHDALYEVLSCEESTRDAMLGALLMGSTKVADAEMIAGFADAVSTFEGRELIDEKTSVRTDGEQAIVGCAGSGKKGRKTFNITTASMVVAAAAGGRVLKAGSRATSSVTGSSDILEVADFKIPNSQDESTELLHATNFGYYSIEHSMPDFDSVYGNRFFAPHALSHVLPALLIPVKVDTLFYGYAGPDVLLSARALQAIGYNSLLACNNTSDGIHYIDEMATTGMTALAGVIDGQLGERRTLNTARYLNIADQQKPDIDTMQTMLEQRELFMDVLGGKYDGSIAENTVCLNAATMLYLGSVCDHPKTGFGIAQEAIRDGSAASKLNEIIDASKDIVR